MVDQTQDPIRDKLLCIIKDKEIIDKLRLKRNSEFLVDIAKQLHVQFFECRNAGEKFNPQMEEFEIKINQQVNEIKNEADKNPHVCLDFARFLFYSDFTNYLIDGGRTEKAITFDKTWIATAKCKYEDLNFLKVLQANVLCYDCIRLAAEHPEELTSKGTLREKISKNTKEAMCLIECALKQPSDIIPEFESQRSVYIGILEDKKNLNILKDIFKRYQKVLFSDAKDVDDYLDGLRSFFCARMARLYEASKMKDKQRSELKKALHYYKNNSFALVQMASLKLEGNDLHHAMEDFQKTLDFVDIQFDGAFGPIGRHIKFQAYLGLGYINNEQGRYKDAEYNYNCALSYKPDSDSLYNNVVLINRGRNRLDSDDLIGSLSDFKKALECINQPGYDTNNSTAQRLEAAIHNDLGLVYFKQGLHKAAQDEFDKAIILKSDLPHPYYNLGVLVNEEGDESRAKKLFKTAINIDSNFVDARKAIKKMESTGLKRINTNWYEWWFGGEASITRKAIGTAILIGIGALLINAMYFLFFTDKDVPSSTYAVIFVLIVLLMLSILSKLKVGPVELDVTPSGENPQVLLEARGIGIASIDHDIKIGGLREAFYLNFILY